MRVNCYSDNVLLRLEPQAKQTASGLHMVRTSGPGAREHRTAVVVASGPGYHTRLGALVPNDVAEGDRVLVDALAGDKVKWDWDLSAPRQNEMGDWSELLGERGEFRIVRCQEILGVLEPEAKAAE